MSNDGRISGATSAEVQISDVTSADGGDYDCVVSTACGELTSSPAALTVIGGNPIPTVSKWGMLVMGLLMLTAGTMVHALRGRGGIPTAGTETLARKNPKPSPNSKRSDRVP